MQSGCADLPSFFAGARGAACASVPPRSVSSWHTYRKTRSSLVGRSAPGPASSALPRSRRSFSTNALSSFLDTLRKKSVHFRTLSQVGTRPALALALSRSVAPCVRAYL